MTPNPVDIAMNHGRSGHVYAYKVPEWVIEKSGGLHRYDTGSEVLIPEDVWNEAGKEIEFLGKSMDHNELHAKIDKTQTHGRGSKRKPTKPSWLSDDELKAWEDRQKQFNIEGLRSTKHPEDAIKILKQEEIKAAIAAIESEYSSKPDEIIPAAPGDRKGMKLPVFQKKITKKDEELLAILKKNLSESVVRSCIRKFLNEQRILAVGMCFPFAIQKAEEWFDSHFEARKGRAPKRHPDLNNMDKFKVVHGKVTDQWKTPPKPIVHAWVEMGDPVFDDQTKMTKPDGVPKDVYYDMYQPEVIEEYTAEEAVVNCTMKGEGPWNKGLRDIMNQRDSLREFVRRSLTEQTTIRVGEVPVRVEIADTEPKRSAGLMGRKTMPEGEGMLFKFDDVQPLSFWMKNTYIPLSIAFIDEFGIITVIKDMTPESLDQVTSDGPALYALEVPRGWFRKNNLLPGHKVLGIPGLD